MTEGPRSKRWTREEWERMLEEERRAEAARLLIEAGADLDQQNNDGSTALLTAAFFAREEIVAAVRREGPELLLRLTAEALRALAWHGRYLVIGFASGAIPNFPANLLLLKEASAMGVWWGPWATRNAAQAVGVLNWVCATRSATEVSISCPMPVITGMGILAMVRARASPSKVAV